MNATVTVYDCAAYLRRCGYLIDGDSADNAPKWVSVKHIQQRVSEYFNIPIRLMTSPSRQRIHARPRQIAMYLAREFSRQSLPQIGHRFGGRDHTTVIHAIQQVEKLRLEDPEICQAVRWLEADIVATGGSPL